MLSGSYFKDSVPHHDLIALAYAFTHSFIQQIEFNIYHVPGSMMDAGIIIVNEIDNLGNSNRHKTEDLYITSDFDKPSRDEAQVRV